MKTSELMDDQVVALLADRGSHVFDVALAIGAVRDRRLVQAVPLVIAWLRDTDISIVDAAAATLAALGAKEAVPELIDLLRLEAEDERRINCAVDPFGWYEPPPRESAAAALGMLGATEAVPQLTALLDDPISGVREQAAAALERLGSR